jgi:hypothetical protein
VQVGRWLLLVHINLEYGSYRLETNEKKWQQALGRRQIIALCRAACQPSSFSTFFELLTFDEVLNKNIE